MPQKQQEGQDKNTRRSSRRVRYQVAMSLDGFIAGPNGEADWIITDPEIDFKEIYSWFDTMLIGRRTFEVMKGAGGSGSMPGMQVYVCSRTLRQEDYPAVTIVAEPEAVVTELRSKPGKDVWLFGGGSLFGSLAELRLVDTVEVAVIPVLLGEGVPLLPAPTNRVKLKLTGHKLYAKTGIMSLQYAVQYGPGPKRRK
jgi:dihydrofolate reductase